MTGTDTSSWVLLIYGLLGGGGVVGLVGLWANRKNRGADATVALGEAAVTLAGGYDGLLTALQSRVNDLDARLAFVEGKLDRTERERDWWRARCHQLEELLHTMKIPIPHPVPLDVGDDE